MTPKGGEIIYFDEDDEVKLVLVGKDNRDVHTGMSTLVMIKEILSEKEQLFLYLVGTFHSSARIALGKNENPMTKSININVEQASFYIDVLDLIQEKTKENLTDYEEQMLINTISELKLNLIDLKLNELENNISKLQTLKYFLFFSS